MLTSAAAPAAGTGKRVFMLYKLYLKNGTQPDRVHEYFSKGLLPVLKKLHSGPKIYMQALVASHMPQVATIVGFASLAEYVALGAKLDADAGLLKAFEAWESGSESPYESVESSLLEAADYCPELDPETKPRRTPRVFELRSYHSPTMRQLKALHERFAGPEIRIFHRVGVHPILYASTLIGSNVPNLVYLTPFDSLAAREKAWDAFGADPEWIKVRKESIEKHGQVSSIIQISLYRAMPYSPIL